jgi:tRNA threonylcarbamoyladenosine biosynthesis protein TsaB
MLLAIDTATRWVGLALHDGAAVVAESGWQCFNTHTIELTPAVHEMLMRAGLEAADLNGIAVAIGPGSYTGLRVGLALAKGLALANQIALIGVPTLDIVAAAMGPLTEQLLVAASAGRHRVCINVYRWDGHQWIATGRPVIQSWEDVLEQLEPQATVFTGEITPDVAKLIRAASKEFHLALPASAVRRAGYLAELGWRKLRQESFDDAGNLAPTYLRDPAAN